MRYFMNRLVLYLIGIICFVSVAFTTFAQAETLFESSVFCRIYVGFSVDQKAAQAWLPAPWKVVPVPKGPLKGANLLVLFDDRFIMLDGEGKPYKGVGTFRYMVLVSFGKNEKTGEPGIFVTRVYWSLDDPGSFKNGVKAEVSRWATIKASDSGTGSEMWNVVNSAGGIVEFRMDYQRALPTRTEREFEARSSVDPDILFKFRDTYATDVVKSIPAGIDRVKNFKFRVTIPELRKMFDGSEKLVGISMNPSRVRQRFLP